MVEKKPRVNSKGEQELEKVAEQFEKFDEQVQALTMDRMSAAPKQEVEQQTKLSQNQIANAKDVYLKPHKTISSKEKFNENFREAYNFDKEYVYFIAENKELIGETIDMWTKPYPGLPAEWWKVPVNKPIWAPRYVAEQLKKKSYHRLVMDQTQNTGADGMGQYYGTMAVDTTIQRLDAIPATKKRSLFLGANGF